MSSNRVLRRVGVANIFGHLRASMRAGAFPVSPNGGMSGAVCRWHARELIAYMRVSRPDRVTRMNGCLLKRVLSCGRGR